MTNIESLSEMKFDTVLIVDFGGQYSHLIAKRVREQGVFSELVPHDITVETIMVRGAQYRVKGLILSGGPSSVYMEDAPKLDPRIFQLGIPVLGLCYGHQLIAYLFHGRVRKGERREYGSTIVHIKKPVDLLTNLNREEKVWMSHYDTVYSLPSAFEVIATSNNCPIAAFRHITRPIYGLQWHPEVTHTEHGKQMLRNFIFNICKCEGNWKPFSVVEKTVEDMKRFVGTKKAIIALSGGIDSTTATMIASKAIGQNLTAVFVDHGFMREGEPQFVEETFTQLGINIQVINAQNHFALKLKGVVDPEEKRKIMGREFIKTFERVAKKIGAEYLIQGTIYPDRIESGIRNHSEKIKSHHNVAGIPPNINFKSILEPLKDLYKYEVREIAQSLGVPRTLIYRQPFPGPGLAIRIIGEATTDRAMLLRKADTIVTEEIERDTRLKEDLWQYFAVLTNIKSTGIKGDTRAYGYVLAIRAVDSQEAMTACVTRIPYNVLEKISTRITNELPQITRVVYDISHKPPATIEWE